MVQKVRSVWQQAHRWKDSVTAAFESGTKPTYVDAKAMFEEGEKLKLNSSELKKLKNGITAARTWLNRIKRSKVDRGGCPAHVLEELIAKYNDLTLVLPEELDQLKQATKGYCICRRPYEGFMIGCDGCDEWYHGSCIGISESQADRVEKFLCVRCRVMKVYRTSSQQIAGTIRKWTCKKHLKKARQIDSQKHKRKVRKERKDIEELQQKIHFAEAQLSALEQPKERPAMPLVSTTAPLINGPAATAGSNNSPLFCQTVKNPDSAALTTAVPRNMNGTGTPQPAQNGGPSQQTPVVSNVPAIPAPTLTNPGAVSTTSPSSVAGGAPTGAATQPSKPQTQVLLMKTPVVQKQTVPAGVSVPSATGPSQGIMVNGPHQTSTVAAAQAGGLTPTTKPTGPIAPIGMKSLSSPPELSEEEVESRKIGKCNV